MKKEPTMPATGQRTGGPKAPASPSEAVANDTESHSVANHPDHIRDVPQGQAPRMPSAGKAEGMC